MPLRYNLWVPYCVTICEWHESDMTSGTLLWVPFNHGYSHTHWADVTLLCQTPILYIVYSIHIIWFIIQNNQKISQIYLQAQIPRCLAKSKLHCVLSKEASHTLLDYNMLTCPSLTTLVQQRRHQADTLVPPNLHFSLYLSPYRTYTYAENRHSIM